MIEALQLTAQADYQKLPPRETIRLVLQVQHGGARGRAALEKLIHANLRLILKEAKRYNFLENAGAVYTVDDVLSCAFIGFIRGVQLFQPSRRIQLSTYLVTSMRRTIVRGYQTEGQALRNPVHAQRQTATLRRATNHLTLTHHRAPSQAELARATGIAESTIRRVQNLPTVAFSLDMLAQSGDDPTAIGDVIPAPADDAHEISRTRAELMTYLQLALPDQFYKIFTLYHGLDPQYPDGLTMTAIAKLYGVTRQRIEQKLKKAATILRSPRHAPILRQLLNRVPQTHPEL